MKTIKQGMADGMCAVCVVAMATNTQPADVYAFLKDGRVIGDPIAPPDEVLYLAYHGWILGTGFYIAEPEPGMVDRHFNTHYELDGQPAYVVVESNNHEGFLHAIFWDGENLRDPDPRKGETSEWNEYTVRELWPLTKISGHRRDRFVMTERPTPEFVLEYRAEIAEGWSIESKAKGETE